MSILGFLAISNLTAIIVLELEAIKHGLEIAWTFGFRRLWCETDSLEAFNVIVSVTPSQVRYYA